MLPLVDETTDRRFTEPNRWGSGELEETPLKPELVVEVRYDKLEKHRFRHGTRLLRFRPDKDAAGLHVARGAPAAPRRRPRGGRPAAMKVRHLTPVLNVSDVAASIEWFEALGWERGFVWTDEGGMGGAGEPDFASVQAGTRRRSSSA